MIKDPWHFPRPELARAYLRSFELGLTAARGLFARRRMGKSEFLKHNLMLSDNRSRLDCRKRSSAPPVAGALTDELTEDSVKVSLISQSDGHRDLAQRSGSFQH